jgi:tetratricopeptide (TPR) repeat protein
MPPFNYLETVATLQDLRSSGERRSDLVVSLGKSLIKGGYTGKLGDEVWPTYEQIAVDAFDVGDLELADVCLSHLKKRFVRSARVKRLVGMRLETEGKLVEANEIYESILAEDETNMPAAKRAIAVQKARGNQTSVISLLTTHLDTYYNDTEAWLELCSVYLAQYYYQQAAFCMEELLLMQTANPFWHLKYAEILWTMGEVLLALKEFCKVVELQTDHVRGFYGVQLCTTNLLKSHSGDASDKQLWSELNELATEHLLHVHKKASEETKKVVRLYLESLQ